MSGVNHQDRSPSTAPPPRRDFLIAAALTGAAVGMGGVGAAPASGQTGPPVDDALQRVIRAKQLNVAVVIYPPLTIKQGSELSGTFVDAARWLAKQMDVTPNFLEAEWGTFIAAIQSGRADIALAGSFATVPRAMAVDFTKNVMWMGSSVLVRKADIGKWKTLEDADRAGIRFVTGEGSAMHERLKKTLTSAQIVALPPGTSPANMAVAVMSNRADVYLQDDWLIKKLVSEHKDRLAEMPAYADRPWNLNAVSWAVAKGQTSMINVLNVAIDRLTDNNLFQQWDEKYGAHWLYKKEVFYQSSRS
jgi:polar amino acid transport system substrate-binding protein